MRRPLLIRRSRWRGGRFLKKLARVWSRRLTRTVDRRRDGKTNEQGQFVRIVVDQVKSHRQALNDLDEITGGILGRQQRQRRAGAKGEAGDASFKLLSA